MMRTTTAPSGAKKMTERPTLTTRITQGPSFVKGSATPELLPQLSRTLGLALNS